MWLGEMRHDAGLLLSTDLVTVCLPANYQPGTIHKNREGVLFSTLLIAAIALLSAPLGLWPLLPFLLAFLVSYDSSWLQRLYFFILLDPAFYSVSMQQA